MKSIEIPDRNIEGMDETNDTINLTTTLTNNTPINGNIDYGLNFD